MARVIFFFAATACWGLPLPHQHAVDAAPQQASDSTRNGFYILLLCGSNCAARPSGPRAEKDLGRRRQRRVVDAPLLPGHEVVQQTVEVVREVRVVLHFVVRAGGGARPRRGTLPYCGPRKGWPSFLSTSFTETASANEGQGAGAPRASRALAGRRSRQFAHGQPPRARLTSGNGAPRGARLVVNTFRRRRDLGGELADGGEPRGSLSSPLEDRKRDAMGDAGTPRGLSKTAARRPSAASLWGTTATDFVAEVWATRYPKHHSS